MSMPIVATAVPKMPPTSWPAAFVRPACEPSQWEAISAIPMVMRGDCRGLVADSGAADDVGRGPGLAGLRDLAHRAEGASRVELGDVDERDAGREADDPGEEEPDPHGNVVGTAGAAGVHHHVGRDRKSHHGQGRGDPVAAVEDVHRVLGLLAADEEHRDDGGEEAEGSDDEREEDPGLGVGPAGRGRDGKDRDAQDHGADVLGSRGLEQVGPAAGAVAHVVAHEVRDHAPRCGDRPRGCPSPPCPRGPRRRPRPWCRCRRPAGRTGPRSWRRSRSPR